ncbi:hypothetical protein L249_1316 [Ophiocordyceps polyrhachis-furcata BCC 54312]|uniref:Uncharacterized protein n=1 Tax=Ophiocordyceps polyrhachis-furcata BCC 54312 TaxID=1330021 RepID=A0A367LD06_9HYPO|nr:hypothetical protein L249_1316 [Ophiocordyceps polyrhachis-furcata BCC 54312]
MSARSAEDSIGMSPTGDANVESARHKEEQQNPSPDDNGIKDVNEDDENEIDDITKATQPLFEPLFTLLTNTTTNTTIHPHVRYLFTDDDPSILSAPDPSSSSSPSSRAMVVDLLPDPDPSGTGWKVSWAASLSADFAVSDARILSPSSAPSTSGAGVLRLDGVEREPVEPPPPLSPPLPPPPQSSRSSDALLLNSDADAADGGADDDGHGGEDLQALAEDFRRRMTILQSVVAEADRRIAATKMQDDLSSSEHHQQKNAEKGTADEKASVAEDAEPR